ncbi:MAG: DUF2849 domain-containing protein [Gammaproteobacteria bacterium]|nr:DUF2849 domain-containing protein [Gammaproteobacteria bacterium]NND37430.1 DUF2849 domain-containing protein [Gammaproteobacteria bacterium]
MSQMLIANRLGDGVVVFRAPDGAWVESIEDGALVDDAAADELLNAGRIDEQNNLVIDPNLIAVGTDSGRRRPERIREAIRAAGPTIEVET